MAAPVLAPPDAVSSPVPETIADLLDQLGAISPDRVLLIPQPGTATEEDLLDCWNRRGRLCELVDGTLVEKAMGYYESLLASELIVRLGKFLEVSNLGKVTGEAGAMRLRGRLVRMPDVAFVAWERLPGRKVPKVPIPDLAPDLAVEILSVSNTRGEMQRKVREYFAAGTQIVWLVDPRRRTVRVYTSATEFTTVTEEGELEGGSVLPGFRVSLRAWLDETEE